MSIGVTITGWQNTRESSPISLVDAMREHVGLSLPAAKKLLDELARMGRVTVPCATVGSAERFLRAATAIGAVALIAETDPD
jgi:hypothetical protein